MTKGFYAAYLYDVAKTYHEGWDNHYTLEQTQQSDDGSMVWVVGDIPEYAVESFANSADMFKWCYENGWAKLEADI